MPRKRSNLRQVSNGASSGDDTIQNALQDAVQEHLSDAGESLITPTPRVCTLGFHDDSFSKLEALVNSRVFPSWNVGAGTKIRIVALGEESARHRSRKHGESQYSSGRQRASTRQPDSKPSLEYMFTVREVPADIIAKHPNLQLSISRRVATALGFKRDSQVVASMVDENEHAASHVEIAFRDVYLTRADMWRLVISELAGKSMYKGQKLTFMNTIKAQIKAIYQNGSKRQSAFFGTETKPIFRSESARYVLFIQMSEEMWLFDTDGTGDIMFHKVIDGFLPELFKRWQDTGARHLVSIILFTRMVYERPLATSLEPQTEDRDDPGINYDTENLPYKDFYRVLISDMSSGSWNDILVNLKADFKTFLRDVSIRKTIPTGRIIYPQEGPVESDPEPIDLISGYPTCASKGNILEAINVASSQFSGDYIDRDLVRTGLSIIVVTPGTGVFEVDYDLLSLTTDVLIENGVGIDLVCLSRMPLHSVPLFKYKRPRMNEFPERAETESETVPTNTRLSSSFESTRSYIDHSQHSHPKTGDKSSRRAGSQSFGEPDPWLYGVPHWVDISFWTPPANQGMSSDSVAAKFNIPSQKPFVPRVRMDEVQMMGIMEKEMSNISIPYMTRPPKAQASAASLRDLGNLHDQSSSASMSSSFARDAMLTPSRASPSNLPNPSSISPERQPDLNKLNSLLQWMEDYDDAVFRHPLDNTPEAKARREAQNNESRENPQPRPRAPVSVASSSSTAAGPAPEVGHATGSSPKTGKQPTRKISNASSLAPSPLPRPKASNFPRQLSFGFRGFGSAAPKATPVTELSSENAHVETLSHRHRRPVSPQRLRTAQSHKLGLSAAEGHLSQGTRDNNSETVSKRDSLEQDSKTSPIAIKAQTRDGSVPRVPLTTDQADHEKVMKLQDQFPVDKSDANPILADRGLSPNKAMAPWLTVLKPWNPSSADVHPNKRIGRWQHVFPKSLHASHMKWRSLCSPASVPLTTEGFPTNEELSSEYDKGEYTITPSSSDDTIEESGQGSWLMREIISARFSHGFQIVLSDRLAESFKLPSVDKFTIYDDNETTRAGAKIFMLRGSNIHLLEAAEDGSVHITLYNRRPAAESAAMSNRSTFIYRPVVRTTLGKEYRPREIAIPTAKEAYDWHRLDIFISGSEAKQSGSYPDALNFWRARYLFIPIEQSSNSKRRAPPLNEDNDEEIRLEGIRKLTQLLQKNKYVSPKERRFQSSRKREDANPLDIIYQTRNPSAIVASEMHEALLLESETNDGKPAQLLPDSDLFEQSKLKIKDLANTIQGERGVHMMDRRWHWRLHYNCFIGMELTTWLLNNFRDIDTRDEAVELGNMLMKEGLFVHVERRHNFRDGNFFYQIAPEFRLTRAEARNSWFGRSVPPTPMTETIRNSPRALRSRSGTDEFESSDGASTPTKKQKLGVALSKRLVYDVDHRHRSYRPELITVHYDRISSADDCYHLRVDWMNATPKLIEDSIATWANLAERNGLHLVEVPIAEASKISEFHPFRGPYMVSLAKPPPDTQPNTCFDTSSLSATKPTSNHVYHKAILRKFNFVLDLEAATDFPPSVDVEYSWGKPDYQFPQYISREGVLLAQITDKGEFLLLANRLYNNRTSAAREAYRNQSILDRDPAETGTAHHRSPARVPSARLASPRGSPHQSPSFKPASDTPVMRASADVGLGAADSKDVVTPEKIKNELEAFCGDIGRLERFYEKMLGEGKGATPAVGPATPGFQGVGLGTPRSEARRGLEVPPGNFTLM